MGFSVSAWTKLRTPLNSADLIELFESIDIPKGEAGESTLFSAYSIPGFMRYRVGKDTSGNPSLLIAAAAGAVREGASAPIVLEHLRAQHNANCRISRPDGSKEQGLFSVITCTSTERELHCHFLRVCSALVDSLGQTPSHQEVTEALHTLVELFRALARPPRKTIQGVWGELLLVVRARRSEVLVNAWHATPEDRYDFNAGAERLEVKTTAKRIRQHYFALAQLRPPEEARALVASIFVERSGAGTSLGDLMKEARLKLQAFPALIIRVEIVVAETLGSETIDALEDRFDRELAEESVAFYDVRNVPQPLGDMPLGVSEVHFMADLTGRVPADLTAFRGKEGLFGAVVRARN